MVADELSDGVRIAQLLASEVDGDGGRLRELSVTDADPDVEPTADGAVAYRVVRGGTDGNRDCDADGDDGNRDGDDGSDGDDGNRDDGDGDREVVAEAYVQRDRARVEFVAAPDAAADAASEAGLRVRPKAVRPPRTLAFVENGAEVKRALPVFEAVLSAVDG